WHAAAGRIHSLDAVQEVGGRGSRRACLSLSGGRGSRRAALTRLGWSLALQKSAFPDSLWMCPPEAAAAAKGSAMTAIKWEVLPGQIALVTFDQPGSRANTLGQAILGELEQVLAELRKRTDLAGLVFRSGKEGMFIAGADLKELGGAKPDPELSRRLVKRGLDLIAGFEKLPYPTVAAIDGACMGGGLELALGFGY